MFRHLAIRACRIGLRPTAIIRLRRNATQVFLDITPATRIRCLGEVNCYLVSPILVAADGCH